MIHNNLVFIIDDDILQNEIHELILHKSFPDIEIKSFTRTSEALSYIDNNIAPQIIFLDINIPGENGTRFLDKFKKRGLESDIYLMSSIPYLDYKDSYADYPAIKDFISKPLLENKVRPLFNHYA